MTPKFSTRVALLAFAYAAIVAAAFFQGSVASAYFIWLLTLGSLLYVLLLVLFARERTRVVATGALLAMAAAIAVACFSPNLRPVAALPPSLGIERAGLSSVTLVRREQARIRDSTVNWSTRPAYRQLEDSLKSAVQTAAVEAISLQLIGIAGAVIGAYAFRHVKVS